MVDVQREVAAAVSAVPVDDDDAGYSAAPCSGDDVGGACSVY